MPNISRSKGYQTMKFGQLIEYKGRNVFLEKSIRRLGREIQTSLCFFKVLFTLVSIYFDSPALGYTIKTLGYTIKTLHCLSRYTLNVVF